MTLPDPFVRPRGHHFELGARRHAFAGVNLWYAAYLGQDGASGDRARLHREVETLRRLGVDNLRILAASEGTAHAPLTSFFQPAPGQYNERLLEGLDYTLALLGRNGLRAVLYLNNQWEWSGGMASYVEWATGEPRPPAGQWPATLRYDVRFYALPAARRLYLDYVRMLVTRRNTVSGLPYAQDPAIMAWQLCNEPRTGPEGESAATAEDFLAWAGASAALIRSLGARQLVSTGSEGLVGCDGQAGIYTRLHALPEIDYVTAHVWPFNWGWYQPKDRARSLALSLERTQAYLDAHIRLARELGKPLVLEEFGLGRDDGLFFPDTPVTARDTYVGQVLERFRRELAAGSPLAGVNLWSWSGEGRPLDPAGSNWRPGTPFTGDNGLEPQGLNSLYASDHSTLELIRNTNQHIEALTKS